MDDGRWKMLIETGALGGRALGSEIRLSGTVLDIAGDVAQRALNRPPLRIEQYGPGV